MEKKEHRRMTLCCDAQERVGALEEDVGVSPSLVCRDGDVSVQTVAEGGNLSA